MIREKTQHAFQQHKSILDLLAKLLSLILALVLMLCLLPITSAIALEDGEDNQIAPDVTTAPDVTPNITSGINTTPDTILNITPDFTPAPNITPNITPNFTPDITSAITATQAELFTELSVTFLVEGEEYEVYTKDNGLTQHMDGDGVYFISDAAPGVDLPPGKVSFRGWYEESSDEPFDFSSRITESITLTAKFSETYLISFKNGDGKVVYTREYLPGAYVYPPDASIIDEINTTAPAGNHFEYWFVEGDLSAEAYFLTSPIALSDLTLIPLFGNYWYIIFVSAGDQVDNPVQLVRNGEHAIPPSNPVRTGYTFIHWSETEDGAEFLFTTPITHNTNLFAVWDPEMVAYTVAIWMEKPNIIGTPSHPGGNKSQYNYVTSVVLQGRAWTWTSVDGSIVEIVGAFTTDPLLRYAEFQDVEQQIIQGNGLTVVSLYAKRKVYTYQFDLGTDTNKTMYIAATNTTYRGGTGSPRYSIQFKYEMEIAGLLPLQGLPSVSTFSSGFASWQRPNANGQYSAPDTGLRWESTANIASIRNVVDRSMIAQDGKQLTYVLAAAWTASGNSYNYRYFMETLPSQIYSPQKLITLNEKTYVEITELNQGYQGNLSQKTINGLKIVKTPWTNSSTTYEWLPYNYSVSGGYSAAAQNATAVSSTSIYRCFFYERNSFQLSFYLMSLALDVVTDSPTTPQTVKYQESLAAYAPALEPGREGYIFAGWYRDSDYQEPFDFAGLFMPNGPMSVYAKWEFDHHILTFYDKYGGIVVDKEGVEDRGYATHSVYTYGLAYERYGEFLGWHYLLSGKLIPFNYDIPIRGSYHLYAVWKTDGFKVIYNAGEGTGTVPVNPNSYELGTEMRAEPGDSLTGSAGKVFYAWLSSTDGKLYYPGSIVPIFGTTTLTAQYANISDLVILAYVENFNGSIASINYPAVKNETTTLQGEIFTQTEGFILIGWADLSDATEPDYALDEPDYMVTGNKTFYGVWAATTYTVIFDPGTQGTWAATSETYGGRLYGSAIPQFNSNTAIDHNPGYIFSGWLDADDTTIIYATEADLPATVTRNLTFVAQWSPLFRVTFYDWDGTVLSIQYVLYGQDALAPVNPTRTAYNFLWWDKGYNNVTSDLDIHAVYAPITSVPPPTTGTEDPEEEAPPPEVLPPPVSPPAPVTPTPTPTPTPSPTLTPQPGVDQLTTGIGDQQTPLFVRVSWALFNLIMMILDVLIMLILLITYFIKRKKEKDVSAEEHKTDEAITDAGALHYDYLADYENKSVEEQEHKKKRLWPRLLTILLAVIAIILFFLFEDMKLPMVYTNQWTIWHFVILVLVSVCAIVASFRKDRDKAERQEPQRPVYPQYTA